MRHFGAAALIGVTVALVAGCSAQPATEAATETLPPPLAKMLFPDGAWLADTAVTQAAQEHLVARCLSERGFDYPEPPARLSSLSPLVVTEHVVPRRHVEGYGLAGAARADAATDMPTAEEADAWQRALYGRPGRTQSLTMPSGVRVTFPIEGCFSAAKERLFGSDLAAARVSGEIQDFSPTLAKEVAPEPDYEAALADWQQCMTAQGLTAHAPGDLIDRLRMRYADSGVNRSLIERERTAARADAECDADTGLRAAFRQAATRLVLGLSARVREDLTALALLHSAAAAEARSVLARSRSG